MKLTVEKLLTRTGWQTAQTLIIEKGIVQAIRPATPLECAATLPGILVPGSIDTQVNGGGGVLLNQQPSYDGLCQMANAHLQFGTTGKNLRFKNAQTALKETLKRSALKGPKKFHFALT